MASLFCKNHPELRWYCKDQAISVNEEKTEGYYNGARNIFFFGQATEAYPNGESIVDNKYIAECSCPAKDLRVTKESMPSVLKFIESEEKYYRVIK